MPNIWLNVILDAITINHQFMYGGYTLSQLWHKIVLFVLAIATALLFTTLPLNAATENIATGTVKDTSGTAVANVTVECHTSNGSFNVSGVTNSSGEYTCSGDTSSLVSGTTQITVEARTPSGYNSMGGSSFTWTSGITPTINLQLQRASKTINITVTTIDGQSVQQADVVAQPVNPTGSANQVGSNLTGGVGAIQVTGGKWVVSADRNLSEQDPSRYPWVPVSADQQIEFAADTSVETTNLSFEVVPSAQLVTVKPVDANGAILNQYDFNADVVFSGLTAYGTVDTFAKVSGSTGIAQLYLLPGIYTLNVYHGQQLQNQSFPAKTFIVQDTPGTYDWGTYQAEANSATLSGTVSIVTIDASGKSTTTTPANIPVLATNLSNGRTFQGNTTATGTFTISNVASGEYTVAVNDSRYLSTKTAHAKVAVGETVSGLELEATQASITISGRVIDSNGTAVSNLSAVVVATADEDEFSSAVDSSGSFSIKLYGATSDKATLKLVTQQGASVYQASDVQVTLSSTTVQQDIVTSTNEGTIVGNVVDAVTGAQLTSATFGTGATVVAIQSDNGSIEEGTVDTNGGYSLAVGPGIWKLTLKINDPTATAYAPIINAITTTVTAGTTTTANVKAFTTNGGSVTGKILTTTGTPVAEARVVFTNLPTLQQAASTAKTVVNPANIITITAKTTADGVFATTLPDGTFTAYYGNNPNGGHDIAPAVVDVTIAGAVVDLGTASYRSADVTVTGTVDTGLTSAKVIFYSKEGGMAEGLVAADHTYSVGVTSGTWNVLVSGINEKDELAVLQTTAVLTETTTLDFLTVPSTGVTVPSAASQQCSMSASCIVNNTAGARVELSPFTAGYSGTMTVQLAPRPNVSISTGGIAQIGIAYDVNIFNSSGQKISQLQRPAKISLPIDENLTNGSDTSELTPSFEQADLKLFLSDGVIGETDGSMMTIYTTHLSQFAVSSPVNVRKPAKPKQLAVKKITTKSALLKWKKPSRSSVTKYVVQLRKASSSKATWKKYKRVLTTKKSVSALGSKQRYQFHVKACNTLGCSRFSKWKGFTTK